MNDLTREDVARLRAWIAAAQDPRETPWALIHPEVAEWLATKGPALLALAEAVAGAPVGEAEFITDGLLYVRGQDLAGQVFASADPDGRVRVRLLRVEGGQG